MKNDVPKKHLECLFENLLLDLLNLHSSISREKHILTENKFMLKNIDKCPAQMKLLVQERSECLPSEEEILDNILSQLENLISPHYSPRERKMIYKQKKYVVK